MGAEVCWCTTLSFVINQEEESHRGKHEDLKLYLRVLMSSQVHGWPTQALQPSMGLHQ
jgi:hypothetical protein